MRRLAAVLPLAVVSLACERAPLPRAWLEAPHGAPTAALVPVEASASAPPIWVGGEAEPGPAGVRVVGWGSGPSEARARAAARRDLLRAASMYAAVDVEYAAESREGAAGGSVTERVQVRSEAALAEIGIDGVYWERFASPLAPEAARVDVYLSATVPAATIAAARAAARARRRAARARPTLVVLPFLRADPRAPRSDADRARPGPSPRLVASARPASEVGGGRARSGPGPSLARGAGRAEADRVHDDPAARLELVLQDGLTRQLGGGGWTIADAELVRGVLADVPEIEALRIERVAQVFAADVALSGLVDVVNGRARITLALHDLARGHTEGLGVEAGDAGRPASLIEPLANRAAARLSRPRTEPGQRAGAPVGPPGPPPRRGEAVELLATASARASGGDLSGALAAAHAAIEAEPSPAAFLRAGRVLDRLGRYGKPTPPPQVRGRAALGPAEACTEAGRAALARADVAVAEMQESLQRGEATQVWDPDDPDVSAIVLPVLERLEESISCAPDAQRCVDGCVPEGTPCPPVLLAPRLDAGWRRLFGPVGQVRAAGARLRQGPSDFFGGEPTPVGMPVRIDRVDASGHWLLVSSVTPGRRGWLRRTELELPEAKRAPVPFAPPSAAADAYAAGFALADEAGDDEARMEAALGLGTVAWRQEAPGPALRIFSAIGAEAGRRGWAGLESRAQLGRGRVLVDLGQLERAQDALRRALELRQLVGGQPFELEIQTELGALALQRGRPAAAEAAFDRAWRLARDLSSAYLEVVAGNNLGVLALARGQRGPAHARFVEALDYLRDLGELEGRIAAALNVAHTSGRAGERALAAGLRAEARALALDGGRLAWLAEVALHRGLAGRDLDAVARAARLFAASGRPEGWLRAQASLLSLEARGDAALPCVARRQHALGAPVFSAELGGAALPTLETLAPGEVAPVDLALAADAAAAIALHDWSPDAPPFFAARAQAWIELRDPLAPAEGVDVVLLSLEQITEGAADRVAAPPQRIEYTGRDTFDRVLSAVAVRPSARFALTPARLEAALGGWRGARARRAQAALRQLDAAETHAAHLQLAELQAYLRLNRGGLEWFSWRPGRAYDLVIEARRRFGALEDARGLALTDEWLGYMLRQSDRPDLAAVHFTRSLAFFEAMGDADGAARVLTYAD